MGKVSQNCIAMNALQVASLVILVIGTASVNGKRPCQPGKDVQVVLADRKNRKLTTWTPENCQPQTFEGYPTPLKPYQYADSIYQCSGGRGSTVTFVKNEGGGTQLVSYNPKKKTWEQVPMPSKLAKLSGYAVATWGSALLLVGGRKPDGTVMGQPVNTIWALNCPRFARAIGRGRSKNGRSYWKPVDFPLKIPAYGSCAVVTPENYLTVVGGQQTNPHTYVQNVYSYHLPSGKAIAGSQNISFWAMDCLANPRVREVAIIGRNETEPLRLSFVEKDRVINTNANLPLTDAKLQPVRLLKNFRDHKLHIIGGIQRRIYGFNRDKWLGYKIKYPAGDILGEI